MEPLANDVDIRVPLGEAWPAPADVESWVDVEESAYVSSKPTRMTPEPPRGLFFASDDHAEEAPEPALVAVPSFGEPNTVPLGDEESGEILTLRRSQAVNASRSALSNENESISPS